MGHFARWVLENPVTLGVIGYVLIVVPIMGIWAIHKYGWQHWAPFDKGHKKQYNQQVNNRDQRSLVAHFTWAEGVAGSNPASRTYKNLLMKMTQELQSFTVEEFQADFDSLLDRVENGESFIITSEHGNAVIVPYKEVVEIFEDAKVDDEVIRIHIDHEEGS